MDSICFIVSGLLNITGP